MMKNLYIGIGIAALVIVALFAVGEFPFMAFHEAGDFNLGGSPESVHISTIVWSFCIGTDEGYGFPKDAGARYSAVASFSADPVICESLAIPVGSVCLPGQDCKPGCADFGGSGYLRESELTFRKLNSDGTAATPWQNVPLDDVRLTGGTLDISGVDNGGVLEGHGQVSGCVEVGVECPTGFVEVITGPQQGVCVVDASPPDENEQGDSETTEELNMLFWILVILIPVVVIGLYFAVKK